MGVNLIMRSGMTAGLFSIALASLPQLLPLQVQETSQI